MRPARPFPVDLAACAAAPLLLGVLVALAPASAARAAVGLAMVAFLPGYALLAAMFPRFAEGARGLGSVARVVLAAALSLALSVLVGVALAGSGVRVDLGGAGLALAALTLAATAAAWRARLALAEDERPRFALVLRRWPRPASAAERGIVAASVAALLLSGGVAGFVLTKPGSGDAYTEFWVVGPDGTVGALPATVPVGAVVQVRLGVRNLEGGYAGYRAAVAIQPMVREQGNVSATWPAVEAFHDTLFLASGETWLGDAALTFGEPGLQRVELLLWRTIPDAGEAPYRELHLWVTARAGDAG
ncbi:MAG TPA: DUF1616 domain-containing protein [Candidatus Thermoplasmatota archaeon]|jgi:uncharacterized membrane protein|nr:DUF1616 domain-containing protein [Candidatus Thermoplasmatota archaeon]